MGIAHHANYLVWFEEARIEFLRSLDIRYKDLEKAGFFLVVLEQSSRHRLPSYYDDVLEVRVTVGAVKKLKLELQYQVFRMVEGQVPKDAPIVAEGRTILGSIDAQGKPKVLPPDILITLNEQKK